ncbi:MAG: hypothetical protein RIR83_1243, partial [Pseudomonadota bacterium]
ADQIRSNETTKIAKDLGIQPD